MKNKLAIGIAAGAAALIFLPITKIVIGGVLVVGAYQGYKYLSK
jgi:hypothetical protein